MVGATALAAGIIASALATGGGIGAGVNSIQNKRLKNLYGELSDYLTNTNYSNAPVKGNFKKYLNSVRNSIQGGALSDLSSNDLRTLLESYTEEGPGIMGLFKKSRFDSSQFARDYKDYLDFRNKVGDAPEMIDWEGIANNVNSAIDNETAQLTALYDQNLARQQNLFENELDANNEAYNDYSRQILSNQAEQSQALQGGIRNELDRQQRNAITRGANAAMRLVSNINTQLGLQNQAAANALNTNNTLAQALLQQRQAASQLRSQYSNALDNDTNNRAGLIANSYERKQNARANAYGEAQTRYNNELNDWNTRLAAYAGTNPFSSVYKNSQIKKATNTSTYGI